MKRIFLIFAMLMTISIGMYAQKPTTTKPSVAQLIAVATSSDPLAKFSQLAKANAYRGVEAATTYGVKSSYRKALKGGQNVEMTISLYDINTFEYLFITTYNKNIVSSWEEQIKRLGYHYDNHVTETGLRGMNLETWYYSKPAKPKIKIQYSEFGGEYVLTIGE